MTRRYKLSQDNRLDWRDPDMPVLRYGKFQNEDGSIFVGTKTVEPSHIQQYYIIKLNNRDYNPPVWRNDPSYWWRKREMNELKIKVVHEQYVNQLKLKMDGDICKIFINNGKAYSGIRLNQEQLKQVLEFVQCNIK